MTQVKEVKDSLDALRVKHDGFTLYKAGLPGYPRFFARDSLTAAILLMDARMLRNTLEFLASIQGKEKNPVTGEEPGAIIHERSFRTRKGIKIRKRMGTTEYNACDTTALFLIGHHFYIKLTGDESLAEKQMENIERAAGYIVSHLDDSGVFVVDPAFCGAKSYALKVTYWKDSCILDRENGEPSYPVKITLAHIQNMAGLRVAASLLDSRELTRGALRMKQGLDSLYDKDSNSFPIAVDTLGPIFGANSDMLHALFYLKEGDLSIGKLEGICDSSLQLETSAGYRALSPALEAKVKDPYHAATVWPYDQPFINIGGVKFRLHRVANVSARVSKYLDTGHETLIVNNGNILKGGCSPHLWPLAADNYFSQPRPAFFFL